MSRISIIHEILFPSINTQLTVAQFSVLCQTVTWIATTAITSDVVDANLRSTSSCTLVTIQAWNC